MPARAGIKVTRVTNRTPKRITQVKTKSNTGKSGSGRNRCPTCGKYMGSGKRG